MIANSFKWATSNKIAATAILFCIFYGIAFSLIAVNRYAQFDIFYYDFGIFDSAIWKVSRFQAPIIEHFIVGGKWIWADHFHPSIFLLAPLYWLTDKQEIILVAQSSIIAISGMTLFFIGRHVSKNDIFSLGMTVAYLIFIGIQNALIADFHEATVATLPLMLAFLFLLKKRTLLYFMSFIIFLGFKESNFALGVAMGGTIFLLAKNYRKIGLGTIVLSIIWGLLAIKVIIPHFSGGEYLYSTSLPESPTQLLNSFINNETKIRTLLISFLNFGFLPLAAFQFFPMILTDFASRFYPPFLTLSWGLGMHYSAMTGAILALASVFSYKLLSRFLPKKAFTIYGVILIFTTLYLHRFVLHGPLDLVYNKAFYDHSKNFVFLQELIKKIPPSAQVMTHNNLAAHFTHQDVRLLRDKCDECTVEHYREVMPEYVVIDAREGQNPNNHYGVEDLQYFVEVLQEDTDYEVTYNSGDQWVFKRVE